MGASSLLPPCLRQGLLVYISLLHTPSCELQGDSPVLSPSLLPQKGWRCRRASPHPDFIMHSLIKLGLLGLCSKCVNHLSPSPLRPSTHTPAFLLSLYMYPLVENHCAVLIPYLPFMVLLSGLISSVGPELHVPVNLILYLKKKSE